MSNALERKLVFGDTEQINKLKQIERDKNRYEIDISIEAVYRTVIEYAESEEDAIKQAKKDIKDIDFRDCEDVDVVDTWVRWLGENI